MLACVKQQIIHWSNQPQQASFFNSLNMHERKMEYIFFFLYKMFILQLNTQGFTLECLYYFTLFLVLELLFEKTEHNRNQ